MEKSTTEEKGTSLLSAGKSTLLSHGGELSDQLRQTSETLHQVEHSEILQLLLRYSIPTSEDRSAYIIVSTNKSKRKPVMIGRYSM